MKMINVRFPFSRLIATRITLSGDSRMNLFTVSLEKNLSHLFMKLKPNWNGNVLCKTIPREINETLTKKLDQTSSEIVKMLK